jgi:metal transporter CNNM
LRIELIGEEIYDEFDPEGAHGDRSPYESPTRKRNGADPEDSYPWSPISHQRAQSDTSRWTDQAKSASANVLPSSLRSLGFSRTRSAPPVPRETNTDKDVGDDKLEWGMMDDEKDSVLFYPETGPGHVPPAIQIPKPIKGSGRYPPSVILEQHSTISSYDSAVPAVTNVEGKDLTLPPPTYQKPTLVVKAPAPVRLTSSALLRNPQLTHTAPTTPTISTPALEAILLERKRRLTSTHHSNPSSPHTNPTLIPPSPPVSTGSFGSVIVPSPTAGVAGVPMNLRGVHSSSGKGTMFKSSPLGGGDRAGVVVSERARAARMGEDVQSLGQDQDSQVEKAGLGKD